NGKLSGSETGIAVQPATAQVVMKVAGFPSLVTAGTVGSITVTAYDAYGNVASGYVGTVHVTSSDGRAALPANFTFTAADAGTQAFTVILQTAGVQTVTATDTLTPGLTTSAGTTVNSVKAAGTLLKWDGSAQGNWIGAYGSQGENIVANA